MSRSILKTHYARIISKWPTDILRPHASFQNAMQRRVDFRFGHRPTDGSDPQNATAAAEEGELSGKGKEKEEGPRRWESESELEQLNALYSVLENRYMRKFPLSPKTLRPASNPTYYDDLKQEMDEAPRRGKWEAFWNRWKGFLRFS